MMSYAGQTVYGFGYDHSKIAYTFNSIGYRSMMEYDKNPDVVILGNSVSFGIGLPYDKIFSSLLAAKSQKLVYNFSVGCYVHSNDYQLELLKLVLSRYHPKAVILQINNLCNILGHGKHTVRTTNHALALKHFSTFYSSLQKLTEDINLIMLYWDDVEYNISSEIKDKIAIYNKLKVDTAINTLSYTFGPKSHKLIAGNLYKMLNFN